MFFNLKKLPLQCIIVIAFLTSCYFVKKHYYIYEEKPIITEWAKTHVNNQLESLGLKKISIKDINAAFEQYGPDKCQKDRIVRVQIKNKKVYFDRYFTDEYDFYFKAYKDFLEKCAAQGRLNNVVFLITFHDHGEEVNFGELSKKVPLFVFATSRKNKNPQLRLLTVDGFTLSNWPQLYKDIREAIQKYPWEIKKKILFWRGGTSDGNYDFNNYLNMPRVKMINASLNLPHLINAKFTNTAQMSEEFRQFFITKYEIADIIPQMEHLKYKYQICLDGVTTTYPGYLWRLCSNCLVFKQQSDNVQWFYDLIKPDVHVIEVSNDLHDLERKLKNLENKEYEAQKISQMANTIVEKELTPSNIKGYLIELLNQYSLRLS